MKKLHHYLLAAMLLIGCVFGANAQSISAQEFFENCSRDKFLTTVLVNKELLKKADNVDFSIMGVESIVDKLDVIGIVSAEQKNFVPRLATMVNGSFETPSYKVLMSVTEGDEQTKILQLKHYDGSIETQAYKILMSVTEGDEQTKILQPKHYDTESGYNEFVIIQRESNEMTVVVISGTLSISDINKLKL